MTITLLFTAVIISDILLWLRSTGYWAKAKDYVTAWINEPDDLAIAVSDVLEAPYKPVAYDMDEKHQFSYGDLVIVVDGVSPYYRIGDIGLVCSPSSIGYWVDFSKQGNSTVHYDGIWTVPYFHLRHYEKPQDMTDDKQPDDARFSSPAYDYSKPKAMTAKPDKSKQRKQHDDFEMMTQKADDAKKKKRKTAAQKRKERDVWPK